MASTAERPSNSLRPVHDTFKPGANMGPPQMVRASSAGARPSSMGIRPSMSMFMRPSMVTDNSNVFAEDKIQDARAEVFSTDVLMEGELSKKGENGWQGWKSRMFVLRGHELSYYTVEKEKKSRTGVLKGSMKVEGATVDRVDNLTFSITLPGGTCRILAAPDVQSLMDWMTALAIAAECRVMDPPTELAMVDHSRTTHIILVRHGHYVTSPTPSVDMNGPLTDLGIEQARRTGKFLHDYLDARLVLKRFPQFPIYHSGVKRSSQTAQIMTSSFPKGSTELRENILFREAWPGNPLPSTNQKMIAREKLDNMVSDCARLKVLYRTMFRHLIPDDLHLREVPLTDADKQTFAATVGSKTTQSRLNDRYRVVVCHANIIRWFICKALGVDPDGTWGRMRYNHCGITAIEIDSVGNMQLAYMNQTGHLETTMITES